MENPKTTPQSDTPLSPLERAAKEIERADELVRKDPRAWNEALKILEQAIASIEQSGDEDAAGRARLLGWAKLGRGNILVNTNARPNLEIALEAYTAALADLESITERDPQQEGDVAAVLGNIGHTRFRLGEPEQIAQAIELYRRAIGMLEALPWQTNIRLRHQFATTWLNLGNALARASKPSEPSDDTITAFDQALQCTAELAAEDDNIALLRATIRSSLARSLQWSAATAHLERASREFEQSIQILEKLPFKEDIRLALELASNHANRATLIGRARPSKESIQATLKSGEIALQLAGPSEQKNLYAAETALTARRAICHAFGVIIGTQEPKARAEIQDKATDLVEDGLKIIRLWEERSATGLRPAAQHLFHLGCAFYCLQQPQFLAEFVNDYLDTGDAVMRQSAINTLKQAPQNPELALEATVADEIERKLAELES